MGVLAVDYAEAAAALAREDDSPRELFGTPLLARAVRALWVAQAMRRFNEDMVSVQPLFVPQARGGRRVEPEVVS